MDTTSYKTKSVNKETADKKWIIVDANDQVLGRFASRVAYILRGKNKVTYTPHADTGDNVIVINSASIRLTGNKLEDKEYIHYTGYPGGQRFNAAKDLIKDKPNRIIEKAVKGMLPKTKLGNELFRNLYVYEGSEHPHEGQKPVQFDINTIK